MVFNKTKNISYPSLRVLNAALDSLAEMFGESVLHTSTNFRNLQSWNKEVNMERTWIQTVTLS